MRHAPAALRALVGAYVVLVVLWAFDATTTVLTDPSARPESMLVGDPGLTPVQVLVRVALLLLALPVPIGIFWLCNELIVAAEPHLRVRAVLRWMPVLFVLAICIPALLDDVRVVSSLVITITP
jgi:hypothetical protein